MKKKSQKNDFFIYLSCGSSLTTFICGAQVANSRSQLRKVDNGATTKWGEMFSSNKEARKAILCIVFPEHSQGASAFYIAKKLIIIDTVIWCWDEASYQDPSHQQELHVYFWTMKSAGNLILQADMHAMYLQWCKKKEKY